MKSGPRIRRTPEGELCPYHLCHCNGINHDETEKNEQEKEFEDDGVQKGHEQVGHIW